MKPYTNQNNSKLIVVICFLFIILFLMSSCAQSNQIPASPIIVEVVITQIVVVPSNPEPVEKIPPTPTKQSGREVGLRSYLFGIIHGKGYDQSGMIMGTYLSGIDIHLEGNYLTFTLSKSPITEAEFKKLAYELIFEAAYYSGAGTSTDWNLSSIQVISRNYADYTMSAHVDDHETLVKIANGQGNRSMLILDKYYE